ncbi:hypothetical protein NFI96_034270, partial [Prochilodus magdalenae]
MQLQQRTRSVADYALEFRTVAAGSGWNETALLTAFRSGLNTDIRKELACRDEGLSLNAYISLAIHFDQLKHGDRSSRGVHFIPFTSLPTAFQTAKALFHHVFRLFGIPEAIVSDQ